MMKKILFVLSLIIVMGTTTVFTSCSKDEDGKVSLTGTWKVYGYEGEDDEDEIEAIYCIITDNMLYFSETNSTSKAFEKYYYTYDSTTQLIYANETYDDGETDEYVDVFHVAKLTSKELWLELNEYNGKYADLLKYNRVK